MYIFSLLPQFTKQTLYRRFYQTINKTTLHQPKMVNIGFIGAGFIGTEVIRQINEYQKKWGSGHLPVIAILELKGLLSSPPPQGLNLDTWKQDLDTKAVDSGAQNLDNFVNFMLKNGGGIIVDCTASEKIASLYPTWLKQGLHVVTPNKKAFSGPLELWKEIKDLSYPTPGKSGLPLCMHESSVGAGLPIINTLNDLMRTGDKIIKIEGIFSGTLSYIFNNFSSTSGETSKEKFSDIVKKAKAQGFTEPDPRDDLNGLDVARKVVILGRLSGLDLDLATLPIENIVPEALRGVPTADEFLARLPEYDDYFAKLNEEAKKEGSVLRYVGVVDPKGGSCVKLMRYPASHPFASLKGSDNIIAFYTEVSFPTNPLVVIGAGAGAGVTAFGIFSDILKIQDRVTYKL